MATGMEQSGHLRHEVGMASVRTVEEVSEVDKGELNYSGLVAELRKEFMTRRCWSYEWRVDQLTKLRNGLIEAESEVVQALQEDLGRPLLEAVLMEVFPVVSDMDHTLANLKKWMEPEPASTGLLAQPGSSKIVRQPKGVVLILTPWNYPIQLALLCMAAAICGGNCCVIKPSEVSSSSALLIEKFVNKYMDTKCIRVVQGEVPETTALLKERWDHIMYTGNGAVARVVHKAAAAHLTPVTLELGGKSPTIIDKSCKLDVAVRRVMSGKLINSGQTCIAPDYVLVHEEIKEEFLRKLLEQITKSFGENPKESDSFGRIINERHHDRIARLVSGTHGGKILCGGVDKADRDSKYMPPTVIDSPSSNSDLMLEEIFGPVLPVISVKSIEEAIDYVNHRERPLALYIFAEDQGVIDKIVQSTIAGGITVNDCMFHAGNPSLPFGGIGPSGMGAYHGVYSFREMTHPMAVMQKSTWFDPSGRYPPYRNGQLDVARRIVYYPLISDNMKMALYAAAAAATVIVFRSSL